MRLRTGLVLVAGLTALAVVAATVMWQPQRSWSGAMAASSSQSGHAARLAAAGTDGSWRPKGEATHAWLQRTWDSPVTVSRVVLRADPAMKSGSAGGFLRFSDGSQLSVRIAANTSVAIASRRITWARFTFATVGAEMSTVGVAEFDADAEDGPDGPVVTAATGDGDVAAAAQLKGASLALIDRDSDTTSEVGDAVELSWRRPREITRVAIAGVLDEATTLRSGTIEFSDGSTLPVGGVTDDPTRPTTLAFMARSTTSVRLSIDSVSGSGKLSLAELAVYQRGADPVRPSEGRSSTKAAAPVEPTCVPAGRRPSDEVGVVVRCPFNGSFVDDVARLRVAAGPSYTSVTAVPWGRGAEVSTDEPDSTELDSSGEASVDVDVSDLGPGPFVVAVTASGSRWEEAKTYLQLRRSGEPAGAPNMAPHGRTLVFDEEFDGALSASRTGEGADYVVGKPELGGVTDFGGAIFADPALGLDNVAQENGYLRLSVKPRPSDLPDPQGWDREYLGGMVASARPGGSGFSTQYGYFEARMLAPAEPGTWPAFWLLTNPNLVEKQPVVAEIDAVELYGHDVVSACHTSHQYPDSDSVGKALCGQRWASPRQGLEWHTYGVDVRPDRILYYIDGERVGVASQVAAADQPMFFMLNLALGGGWPIDLASVGDRASLYVDWVRVYV